MADAVFTANAIAGQRPTAPLIPLDITVTGPNPYATGGITGAAALVQAAAVTAGFKIGIDKNSIMGIVPIDTKGYQVAFNKADDKLVIYYGDNDNSSDGPMVQVANGTDLSAVDLRFSVLLQ